MQGLIRITKEYENSDKLKKSSYAKVLIDKLKQRVDEEFEFDNHLLKEEKSLTQCGEFIYAEAKKVSKGERVLMVSDDKVFSWLFHYFIESNEELGINKVIKNETPKNTEQKTKKKTDQVKNIDEELEEDDNGEPILQKESIQKVKTTDEVLADKKRYLIEALKSYAVQEGDIKDKTHVQLEKMLNKFKSSNNYSIFDF